MDALVVNDENALLANFRHAILAKAGLL